MADSKKDYTLWTIQQNSWSNPFLEIEGNIKKALEQASSNLKEIPEIAERLEPFDTPLSSDSLKVVLK